MIEDGRTYAFGLIVQRLLRKLEQKGILSRTEKISMLDDVSKELEIQAERGGVLTPSASAEAARVVGLMQVKPET
jgi:hypothetical protein